MARRKAPALPDTVLDHLLRGGAAKDAFGQDGLLEALKKVPAFDTIVVHSFSRFFRDQFQFEFYLRKLAKNGVQLVSITEVLGDDPASEMVRKIMTLFDEYQSRETAKHTLRAMNENARQGFWNGARPPIGYRTVEAEQRGTKIKKKLEIDPLYADTVRKIFRLALEGADGGRPMGVMAITCWLNENNIRTRYGGRWGKGIVRHLDPDGPAERCGHHASRIAAARTCPAAAPIGTVA